VARELTKLYEEIWRGKISEAKKHFTEPRGEFVLVIAGQLSKAEAQWTDDEMESAIKSGIEAGEAPSQLAARLAEESGWKRREIYRLLTKS
jgi:16S rRNA (cytidine1402-2'-O)-methyltransferase